ncbi:carbohydrate-binding family 9-like protein [Pontiella sulfatireligans]|uniref:Carbohydrate-binding domain-containing protein n=1 Tax=Pontiella sulfatireligans TaxID=2750658 RepID=A0A6C2UT98_9BACT|nr:carbohydrate-binding family 9-like protein [Pontiella sulfatireligans]VGO23552.1 hypothetical protein SCARR_05659 [Pontiella sulfatireligans]
MKNKTKAIGMGACALLFSCAAHAEPAPPTEAHFTHTAVNIDGMLNEPIWKTAPVYQLELPKNKSREGQRVQESGTVQLAWNETHIYFAFHLQDSDLVAEGTENQLHHYKLGDVAEVFLKPKNQTWYWELYVTPAGNKTSFFMPGRGRRGLESNFNYACGLRVASQQDGTLNNWKDRDTAWTAEMAMPIADLTANGDAFDPEADWMIFFNRYNFSRYLSDKEQTMHPPLRNQDNHLYEDYSPRKLVLLLPANP